jgi:hypothetical protein
VHGALYVSPPEAPEYQSFSWTWTVVYLRREIIKSKIRNKKKSYDTWLI